MISSTGHAEAASPPSLSGPAAVADQAILSLAPRSYLDVEMPERFRLDIWGPGGWIDQAACYRRHFERLDDGSYICGGWGSPIWIRCIAHHDGYFEHIDGDGKGEIHRYRLVPLNNDGEEL